MRRWILNLLSRVRSFLEEALSEDTSKVVVGRFKLKIGINHNLPNILKTYPEYGWNLGRLAKRVKVKYKDTVVLDVGANVGDSVAVVRSYVKIPVVCLEGDAFYFKLLLENMENFKSMYAYCYFIGDKNENIVGETEKNAGTLRLSPYVKGKLLSFITLDRFMRINPQFKRAKLLKIDTDGYDLKVIKGGLGYIAKTKPIIFLEYDSYFLSKVGDKATREFLVLEKLGYNKIVFYDNFGRLLLSTTLSEHLILDQLENYIDNRKGAFPYFDVCLFHRLDDKLADKFILNEARHYARNKT